MIVLGGLMLFLAIRMWLVHPLNRVFRLGPFVTPRGIEAVLRLRLTLLLLGAFLFVQGLTSAVFWWARRDVSDPVVQYLGSLGAGLGIWAAVLLTTAVLRLWRVS